MTLLIEYCKVCIGKLDQFRFGHWIYQSDLNIHYKYIKPSLVYTMGNRWRVV